MDDEGIEVFDLMYFAEDAHNDIEIMGAVQWRSGIVRTGEIEIFGSFIHFNSKIQGKERVEEECDIRLSSRGPGLDPSQQRLFMPIKQKTWNFFEGDHYRTRLTTCWCSSERSNHAAKALRLNEDLIWWWRVLLGQHLGHAFTPCRTGMTRYALWGSSVNWAARWSVWKAGRGTEPDLGSAWRNPESLKSAGTPHTLEGQIVRLSRWIAYINHDILTTIRER